MRADRSFFPEWAPLVLACSLLLTGIIPNDSRIAVRAQSPQPNVVVFMADDMGWTDWQYDAALNPTGSVVYETPNLLRLAQQSVNFTNAYAPAAICSPTRSSLLTGKSPARSRLTDFLPGSGNTSATLREPLGWTKNLPAAEITLAESLGSVAGGYTTGHFGKWHLGANGNPASNPADPQNGFDVNIGGAHYGTPPPPDGHFAGSDGGWVGMPGLDPTGVCTGCPYSSGKYLSEALADHAVGFIRDNASVGQPFFMSFWDYAPHIPIQAPQNLVDKYTQKISDLQGLGVDLKGHTNPTYAAMIEKMDEAVGRLLDRLEDPDGNPGTSDSVRDNTIFIFASDNGGVYAANGSPTRNLPLREGKGSLYEGGIREPLMVSWTGNADLAQGSFSDAHTSLYDLYPTLLDLTGLQSDAAVPRNANMDGVSIRSALEGGPFDRGYLYWHYPHVSPQDSSSTLISGGSFVSAAINEDWKLLFFYEDRHYELYNLTADIGETTNLLSFNPGIAHDMSEALNAYLASVGAQMPVKISTGIAEPLPTVLLTPVPGDYNGNTVVDFGDYNAWKMNYGSKTHLAADGNRNGVVDAGDYTIWRNLFHGSGSGAGGGVIVPEPAAWQLGAFGFLYLTAQLRLRRKRRATS